MIGSYGTWFINGFLLAKAWLRPCICIGLVVGPSKGRGLAKFCPKFVFTLNASSYASIKFTNF